MKKKQIEQQIQIAIVHWFKLQYPQLKNCISASANGGKRETIIVKNKKGESKRYCSEGARLKKMGLLAGEPDLFISLMSFPVENQQTKVLGGLYIEVKTEEGKLTKFQKEIIKMKVASGYQVAVCHNIDDAIEVIKDYMKWVTLPTLDDDIFQATQTQSQVLQCETISELAHLPESQLQNQDQKLKRAPHRKKVVDSLTLVS